MNENLFPPSFKIEEPTDVQELANLIRKESYRSSLILIYGENGYRDLLYLAKQVIEMDLSCHDEQYTPVVFIIPGNLTSQLSLAGNVLWFDPVNLLSNGLDLRLWGDNLLVVGGVLPILNLYYAKFIFLMHLHSYRVKFIAYDWRLCFKQRAGLFCNLLRQEFEKYQTCMENLEGQSPSLYKLDDSQGYLNIVTHSEGGLTARGALQELVHQFGEEVYDAFGHFIMQASPNNGFWGMVPVFQGGFEEAIENLLPAPYDIELLKLLVATRSLLIKRYLDRIPFSNELDASIERVLDNVQAFCRSLPYPLSNLWESAEGLALRPIHIMLTKIFIFTWPAWYQMLPFFESSVTGPFKKIYNADKWPRHLPCPDQNLLDQAISVQSDLPPAPSPNTPGYGKWHLLLGTGTNTLTQVHLKEGWLCNHFQEVTSKAGDGIVAENLARMENLDPFTICFPGVNHLQLVTSQEVILKVLEIFSLNDIQAPHDFRE